MPSDPLLRRLAGFVSARARTALSPEEIGNLTLRLADSMACAAGARRSPEAETLGASFIVAEGSATLIGGGRSSMEDAAFYNSWLIRKLDWNDTYISKNGGHPSDFFGAVLALGECEGATGHDVLRAMGVGIHVMLDFCDAANALARGWDPSTYVAIGATAAFAALLQLPPTPTANALAMTTVSRNMLMARTGRVSGWKAIASAAAVRDCLFHIAMARRGLEGPDPAFSGEFGFERMISGPLPLDLDAGRDRSGDTQLKFFPAIYHAQGPLEAALALHRELRGAAIENVSVAIYDFAIRYTADTPDKWDPSNLETADRSLPFLVAHALLRGEYSTQGLRQSLDDQHVRALAKTVKVSSSPEFSARWPQATPSRITVQAAGRVHTQEIDYILGHSRRPLGWQDVHAKFVAAAGAEQAERWLEVLKGFASLPRLTGEVFGAAPV